MVIEKILKIFILVQKFLIDIISKDDQINWIIKNIYYQDFLKQNLIFQIKLRN